MRFFSLILFGSLLISANNWENDFNTAKERASKEHKLILLNFSGSDWCIPCIRMHKQVFEDKAFIDYSEKNLVLLNADFPRLKKNQLSKEQQKKNDHLAEKYNSDGTFPMTLLLTAKGEVVAKWEGFPALSAAEFTNEVQKIVDARQ